MALVPPSDAVAGATDPRQGAEQLFRLAGWIRRRTREITAEADANVLNVFMLAGDCFRFRQEADKWIEAGDVTEVLEALIQRTREAGKGHPTKTAQEIADDYKALYQAAGIFLTWAGSNLPAEGQTVANAVVTVNRRWPNTDLIARTPKPAALQTEIDKLTAVFA